MKIELRYFTGTGNAWKVLDICRATFNENGHQVNIAPVDPNDKEINADLIGFAFPVYAFGMPRIILHYLKSLKKFEEPQDVFFIVTPGDVTGASTTCGKCESVLKRKNCRIVYSDVLAMPNNWIPYTRTDSPEKNSLMVNNGIERAKDISKDILNRKYSVFDVSKIPLIFRILGNVINVMFRHFGLLGLKSLFKVYPSCNACGLCAKACPTGRIKKVNGKPTW